MIWSKLASWIITRGMISGAAFGAVCGMLYTGLYGGLLVILIGSLIGVVCGWIIGTALGFVDSVILVSITRYFYFPPQNLRHYSRTIRIIAIFATCSILTVLMSLFSLSWSVVPITLQQVINTLLCFGGVPSIIIGIIVDISARRFAIYAYRRLRREWNRQTKFNMLLSQQK